jgi:hypothetical protein
MDELFRDPNGGEIGLSLAAGPIGYLVVFTRASDDRTVLRARAVSSDGTAEVEQNLETDARIQRQPAAAWTGTGWLVVWSESRDGSAAGFEVWSRRLAPDGTPEGAATRITDDVLEDSAPALRRAGDVTYLAWSHREPTEGTAPEIVVQRLNDTGATEGTVHVASASSDEATAPTLGYPEGQLVLGYIDRNETGARVRLRPLNARGAPRDDAQTLSVSDAFGNLELAGDEERGAAVYDITTGPRRRDVRFRSFLGSGRPIVAERGLSGGVLPAQSPSIAAFAGGFAVVLRAGQLGSRHLRLELLDADGVAVQERQLASLYRANAPVALRVNGEGRLLTAWVDEVMGGGTILAAGRIRCGQ